MLRWFEHSQVYHPDKTLVGSGAELGRPFEDVFFEAADGVKLNGWYFPASTGVVRDSLAALVCHGNGGNISHRPELVQALLSTGLNVFLFDYRGYGRSAGRPDEPGTYLDAQAAHHWLQRKGFAGRQILAYGESLGGGVAAELALREPLAGVILQSTFTSIPDIGAELFPWLPVRWLARIRYETRLKLPQVSVPILIMHSREDRLIGFHHSQENFSAAKDPKLFWEIAGGHNNPLADLSRFSAGMEKFLQMVQPGAQSAARP